MRDILIRRGDVFLLDFGSVEGRPIRKKRPTVVVQNDAGNRFAPVTIVAAIHHDTRKGLPIHVPVPRGVGGLEQDSMVDCGILVTINKESLGPKIGCLPPSAMTDVDRALKVSLDLIR